MKTLWKSFKGGMKNEHGNIQWKLGEWVHQEGEIKACRNGLHCSERVIDAMRYVPCEILAVVKVKGKSNKETDKEAWSDMKLVTAYKWEKTDFIKLAIFAAELVIDIFENAYPNDDRPRKAIEAAKEWLKHPTVEKQNAAAAAYAAAADAAAYAAATYAAANTLAKCENYIQEEIIPNLKLYDI